MRLLRMKTFQKIFPIVALLVSASVFSQNGGKPPLPKEMTAKEQSDPEALAIVNEMSKRQKASSAQEYFVAIEVGGKDPKVKKDTASTILRVKGQMYRVKIADQDIYCNGTKVWSHNLATNEVQVLDAADMDEDAITPQNIFTIYEKGYKIRLREEKVEKGKNIAVLDLFPMEPKKKDYTSIMMKVDKSNYQIMQAVIYSKDGGVYTYTIKKTNMNAQLDDAIFSFDKSKFPKAVIIE